MAGTKTTPTLAIWVDGRKKLIDEEEKSIKKEFDGQIDSLHKEVSRFHIKEIRNNKYWYKAEGKAKWKYYGSAKKSDPGNELLREASKLEQARANKLQRLRNAVLEELGDHLLVDLGMYKPQAGQMIHSSDLHTALRKLVGKKD